MIDWLRSRFEPPDYVAESGLHRLRAPRYGVIDIRPGATVIIGRRVRRIDKIDIWGHLILAEASDNLRVLDSSLQQSGLISGDDAVKLWKARH